MKTGTGNFQTLATHSGAAGAEIRAARRAGLDVSATEAADILISAAEFAATVNAALNALRCVDAADDSSRAVLAESCAAVPLLLKAAAQVMARLSIFNFSDFPAVSDRVCEFILAADEDIQAIERGIDALGVERPQKRETTMLHDAIRALCDGVRARGNPEEQLKIFGAVRELCEPLLDPQGGDE